MYPHVRTLAADIEAALPRLKPYKMGVGGGLYLYVTPSSGKYWRYKYRFDHKEKTLALGTYPDVSVRDAIDAHRMARLQLQDGQDPCALKIAAKKERAKPLPCRDSFRIAFMMDGALEIETETRLIRLTPPRAEALRSFLLAAPEKEVSHDANG